MVACAAMTAGGVTGCQNAGGSSRRNAERAAAPDPEIDVLRSAGYRIDWRTHAFVGRGQRPLFLEPMGDVLAFQETGSVLSIVEAQTGRVRWSNELANPLTLFVKPLRDGRVIHSSSETELFSLAVDTGNLVGRESFEKVITTTPIPYGDLMIYGTSIGEVMAHVKGVGVKLWGFRTSGAIERPGVRIGDAVGFVAQSGDTVLLNASDGGLLGRVRLFGGVRTDPVTDGTLMFVASLDQSLYAISDDGQIVWRIRTAAPLTSQPSVVGGVLYCHLPDRGMCAIDPATGKINWTNEKVRGTVLCTRGQNVIAWDGRALSIVEPGTGDVIASGNLGDASILSTDGTTDPTIYITDAKGRIAKYLPR